MKALKNKIAPLFLRLLKVFGGSNDGESQTLVSKVSTSETPNRTWGFKTDADKNTASEPYTGSVFDQCPPERRKFQVSHKNNAQ